MNTVVTIWLVITALFAIISSLAIWSRGLSRARGLSVAACLVFSPVSAVALGFSLGWPLPLLAAPAGEYRVLGVKMIVSKGIYVLLDFSDGEPRYYWVRWSRQAAEELQKAMESQESDGVEMKIPPFEWSWERRPSFHPLPQPKVLPDKPRQEAAPKFEQSI